MAAHAAASASASASASTFSPSPPLSRSSSQVRLQPELRLQTTPETREYCQRLSPQGKLLFRLTWVPDPADMRAFERTVVAPGKAVIKGSKAKLPQERVSIPVRAREGLSQSPSWQPRQIS